MLFQAADLPQTAETPISERKPNPQAFSEAASFHRFDIVATNNSISSLCVKTSKDNAAITDLVVFAFLVHAPRIPVLLQISRTSADHESPPSIVWETVLSML